MLNAYRNFKTKLTVFRKIKYVLMRLFPFLFSTIRISVRNDIWLIESLLLRHNIFSPRSDHTKFNGIHCPRCTLITVGECTVCEHLKRIWLFSIVPLQALRGHCRYRLTLFITCLCQVLVLEQCFLYIHSFDSLSNLKEDGDRNEGNPAKTTTKK